MTLEIDWPIRLAAGALALGLVALFVVRALNQDRTEFRSFRRLRSTVKRQLVMRRWLLESMIVFGGSALLIAVVAWPAFGPLLTAAQSLPLIVVIHDTALLGLWIAIGVIVAFGGLTIIGLRGVRRDGGVVMVGDIGPMLPRNRPELGWGAALSINAGIVEEALFRFSLPALLFVVTGEPISAFVVASVVFGGLHAYQGVIGMSTTFAVGLMLSAVYVLTGSILLVMAIHVLFDLRTLVVIPVAVYGVHRIPGTVKMPPPIILARISITLWKPAPITRIVSSVPTVMPHPRGSRAAPVADRAQAYGIPEAGVPEAGVPDADAPGASSDSAA